MLRLTKTTESALQSLVVESSDTPPNASNNSVVRLKQLYCTLTSESYNFQSKDVKQALVRNSELETALEWLCLYASELPSRFSPLRPIAANSTKSPQTEHQLSSSVLSSTIAKQPKEDEMVDLLKQEQEKQRLEQLEKERQQLDKEQQQERQRKEQERKEVEQQQMKQWTLQYMEQLALDEEEEELRKEEEQHRTPEQQLFFLETELQSLIEQAKSMTKNSMAKGQVSKAIGEKKKEINRLASTIGSLNKKRKNKKDVSDDDGFFYHNVETRKVPSTIDPICVAIDLESSKVGFTDDNEDKDEYEGGYSCLFDSSSSHDVKVASQEIHNLDSAVTNPNAKLIPVSDISKSWTGKLPRKILEEYCKKKKLPMPKYDKQSSSSDIGFQFSVSILVANSSNKKKKKKVSSNSRASSRIIEGDKLAYYQSMEDAKNAVATRALFELCNNQPIHQLIPSPFREIFLGYVNNEKNEEQQAINEGEKSLDAIIHWILEQRNSYISESKKVVIDSTENISNNGEVSVNFETMDNWEDSLIDDLDSVSNKKDEKKNRKSFPSSGLSCDKLQSVMLNRQKKNKELLKHASSREKLPIASYRKKILNFLSTNDVLVISGETGCGKTTQVPQFILEDFIKNHRADEDCYIYCTQPRRIAAIGVAQRVANEMGEHIQDISTSDRQKRKGEDSTNLVGYQIRMETLKTKDTKLLFCTTGVLLRKLQFQKEQGEDCLEGISHIIVDEVHERDLQSDFLLILLRNILLKQQQNQQTDRRIKIILMSATVQAEKFVSYFQDCPLLTIPGRLFPVTEYFLEDVFERTQLPIDVHSPCCLPLEEGNLKTTNMRTNGKNGKLIQQQVVYDSTASQSSTKSDEMSEIDKEYWAQYSEMTKTSMSRVDPAVINYDLIEALIVNLIQSSNSATALNRGILVFLPGLGEIQRLYDHLTANRSLAEFYEWILPLHSSLSSTGQQKVFRHPPLCCWKIILSTNIAETSITIDDIIVVIDTGRVKQLRFNSHRQMNRLEETWIAQSNGKQRSGRAGRVQKGRCFRLYPKSYVHATEWNSDKPVLREYAVPDFLRLDLTEMCLQIKQFGYENCSRFLHGGLDVPSDQVIRRAIQNLQDVGALSSSNQQEEGNITPLGRYLVMLPVSLRLGKMLLYGCILKCIDPVLTVVSLLESRPIFEKSFFGDKQREVEAARKKFSSHKSDLLTDLTAFDLWQKKLTMNVPTAKVKEFLRKACLNELALREVVKVRQHFGQLLHQIGFLKNEDENMNSANTPLVNAVICAGIYPNVLHLEKIPNATKGFPYSLWDKSTRVYLNASSINFEKTAVFESEWLMYPEKMHTSRTFITNSNMVSPLALFFFGYNMKIKLDQATAIIDEWIELNGPGRTLVLLSRFKSKFIEFVNCKLEGRSMDDDSLGEKCLQILGLLFVEEFPDCHVNVK